MSKPDYVIDLALPASRRWEHVAKKDKAALKKLVGVIKGFVLSVPKPVFNLISGFFWFRNSRYLREANAFADVLGERRALIQAAQLMYELVHIVDKNSFKAGAIGCTTSVRVEDGVARMLRTLDWALPGMGDATRTFQFLGPTGSYKAVGTVGATSVFTAVHQGGYGIALNDAPPLDKLRSGRAPSFAIRRTMETCYRYSNAVKKLSKETLATSAFFTVCGPGSATLIEHSGKQTVRSAAMRRVAVANHYQLTKTSLEVDPDSLARLQAAEASFKLKDRQPVYERAPINKSITQYRAKMVPLYGTLELF